MNVFRVALAGVGTVGSGVWRNLQRNANLLRQRTGAAISITRVVTRTPARAVSLGVPESIITTDWREAVTSPEVDAVVELIGGTTEAGELVVGALKAGKHVVTANKALLAERGAELFGLASDRQRQLLFEASVAGGIPFIKALREGLIANRIESLYGIINGTCNYILTEMKDGGLNYVEALSQAKAKGFAEADEALDVEGHDAAHKAAVLAALAYGFWVPGNRLYTEGISSVQRADVAYARQLGYEIKLLAIIKLDSSDAFEVRVHPTLVPKRHVLASVDGVYNAVMVRGDVVGDTLYYGRGAGADPTSSAILADVAELACHHPGQARCWKHLSSQGCPRLKTIDEIVSRYYLRLAVLDQPGVLARIATIVASHRIGISSVIQPESHEGELAPLIIMLHDAPERAFRAAVREISAQDIVKAEPISYRVEDFE
jgi:homoserine dehydrogenase